MTLRIGLYLRPLVVGAILSLAIGMCQTSYSFVGAQSLQPKAPDKPYVVEYYYKAMWGSTGEFMTLFKKNHYPYLKKQMELGNILQLSAESPLYHATEDGRWDYRVRIVWKSAQAANDDTDERILKQLFPDQETFKREEQRRFQILLAHWDVPVKTVSLDDK